MLRFSCLLVISFGVLLCCSESSSFDDNKDCWQYVDQWDISDTAITKPLQFFVDSLVKYTSIHKFAGPLEFDDELQEGIQYQIDTIGTFRDREVLDIIYKIEKGKHPLGPFSGKTILLQSRPSSGLYHLMYAFINQETEFFPAPSKLTVADSHQVLYTLSRLGGQGGHYSKHYWTWDDACGCPIQIDLKMDLDELFRSEYDSSYRVSGRRIFVPDSLFLWAYVEKPGDHPRWPEGGKVWIKFAVDSCGLEIIDKGYNPDDIASH